MLNIDIFENRLLRTKLKMLAQQYIGRLIKIFSILVDSVSILQTRHKVNLERKFGL